MASVTESKVWARKNLWEKKSLETRASGSALLTDISALFCPHSYTPLPFIAAFSLLGALPSWSSRYILKKLYSELKGNHYTPKHKYKRKERHEFPGQEPLIRANWDHSLTPGGVGGHSYALTLLPHLGNHLIPKPCFLLNFSKKFPLITRWLDLGTGC